MHYNQTCLHSVMIGELGCWANCILCELTSSSHESSVLTVILLIQNFRAD